MSDIAQGQQSADITPDASPAVSPQREPRVRKLNIIGRRNLFFAISLLIIIPGMYSMWTRGSLLGIDFPGGTEFTLTSSTQPSQPQAGQPVPPQPTQGP